MTVGGGRAARGRGALIKDIFRALSVCLYTQDLWPTRAAVNIVVITEIILFVEFTALISRYLSSSAGTDGVIVWLY